MYLQRLGVYFFETTGTYFRIQDLDVEGDSCWLTELDKRGKPFGFAKQYPLKFFSDNANHLTHKEIDPFFVSEPDHISKADEKKQRERYEFIKPIADQRPDIFYPELRAEIIRKAIAANKEAVNKDLIAKKKLRNNHFGKTKTYNLLATFFALGESENSMLSRYSNCGARGKKRKYRTGVMPGRKTKKVSLTQYQLSDDDIKTIQANYAKLLKTALNNNKRAHQIFLGMFYPKKLKRPSLSQWKHHGEKTRKTYEDREIGDKSIGLKDNRILTSHARYETFGPGSEFQLDSTKDDTHLLSRSFELKYVGRMTLYIGVDNFSGMPVGILLCPLNPSYKALQLLIMNIASDKGELIKRLGIKNRTSEDWPCHHAPAKFLTDRGTEFTGYNIEAIPRNLQTTIKNAPTGRPDLKPIVERYIKKLLDSIQVILENKGLVHKDFGTRMGKDSRKDATITYNGLLKIIVLEILHQVKCVKIQDYPYTEEMIRDGVEAYPLELWRWGRKKGLGSLRSFDQETLRRKILPQEKVTAQAKGFRLDGIDFVPVDREGASIRQKILNSKNREVRLSYDDTNFEVYLNYDSKQYPLKPKLGLRYDSFFEHHLARDHQNERDHVRKQNNLQDRIDTDNEERKVVQEATSRKRFIERVTRKKGVVVKDAGPALRKEKEAFNASLKKPLQSPVSKSAIKLSMPTLTSKLRSIKRK